MHPHERWRTPVSDALNELRRYLDEKKPMIDQQVQAREAVNTVAAAALQAVTNELQVRRVQAAFQQSLGVADLSVKPFNSPVEMAHLVYSAIDATTVRIEMTIPGEPAEQKSVSASVVTTDSVNATALMFVRRALR
jgi:predicted exporter